MEVSINGVPLYRWMVFVRENPNLKWMMTGGTPHFWKKLPNYPKCIAHPCGVFASQIFDHSNPPLELVSLLCSAVPATPSEGANEWKFYAQGEKETGEETG